MQYAYFTKLHLPAWLTHLNKAKPNIIIKMAAVVSPQFRAHVYGNNPSASCGEDEVVHMVVQMLLGSTNDVFALNGKPLEDLFQSRSIVNKVHTVTVDVFHLTSYGENINVGQMSRSLLSRVLRWFSQFGSYIFVCREFSIVHSAAKNSTTSGRQQLAILETVQSTLSDLLVSIDEALCQLESEVLQLKHRDPLSFDPKITLIHLYQRCYRCEAMFRSLAGLVSSAIPGLVVPLSQLAGPDSTLAAEAGGVLQSFAVRGLMQDLNRAVQLGSLLEAAPSSSSSSVTNHANSAGVEESSQHNVLDCGTDPVPPQSAEKGLTLTLPPPCTSELLQFYKLLLPAVCSKYLSNLTSTVWKVQPDQVTTSHAVIGAALESRNAADPDVLALSRLAALTTSANTGDTAGRGVLRSHRVQMQRCVHFLRQLMALTTIDAHCRVPRFLAGITQEALLSSSDVALLQRSHVRRKNQDYNFSRLTCVIQDSVQMFQRTLLPAYGVAELAPAAADPVGSYLATGHSTKVVGVRTIDDAVSSRGDQSSEPSEESKHAVLPSGACKVLPPPAQAEVEGRFISNAHYLRELGTTLSPGKYSPPTTITSKTSAVSKASDSLAPLRAGTAQHPSSPPLAKLMQFSHHTARTYFPLCTNLSLQLHLARADSAAFVRESGALAQNLRFIRDVYLLGQPDLYASVRELCLGLSSCQRDKTATLSRTESADFVRESVGASAREAAPQIGVRHVSALNGDYSSSVGSSGASTNNHRSLTNQQSQDTSLSTKQLTADLREAMRPLTVTGDRTAAPLTQVRNSTQELALLRLISALRVDCSQEWPLSQFFNTWHFDALNAHMRFLLALTASRWSAEYYWMDVISNDSLSISAQYRGTRNKRNSRDPSQLGEEFGSYAADVMQAKRNCRAGLGVWLHTVTALNNIFMAHIHRTRWPAFESAVESLHGSLLLMQSAFSELLRDISASLLLLRELVVEVILRGFVAARAMRVAGDLESAETAATQSPSTTKTIDRKTTSHGATAGSKMGRSSIDVSSSAPYQPSAGVLVAFRQAEDAFAALKQTIADLKHVVALSIKQRAEKGLNERQDTALSELQLALACF